MLWSVQKLEASHFHQVIRRATRSKLGVQRNRMTGRQDETHENPEAAFKHAVARFREILGEEQVQISDVPMRIRYQLPQKYLIDGNKLRVNHVRMWLRLLRTVRDEGFDPHDMSYDEIETLSRKSGEEQKAMIRNSGTSTRNVVGRRKVARRYNHALRLFKRNSVDPISLGRDGFWRVCQARRGCQQRLLDEMLGGGSPGKMPDEDACSEDGSEHECNACLVNESEAEPFFEDESTDDDATHSPRIPPSRESASRPKSRVSYVGQDDSKSEDSGGSEYDDPESADE